jgi:hypothetical protein
LQQASSARNDSIERTVVRASCEPPLSPLRDNDDFILLRCDANCFHLVLPFLSIHFTACELKTALAALKNLWPEDSAAKALRDQSVLFQAFRCPGGHCHLICHGTLNLCLKEEAAYLLQREMEAQEPSDADARTTQLYLV